jgi:SSS family solute:Na+ symporter
MGTHFYTLDWMVLVAYFIGTMSIGVYFWYQNKSTSTEGFTVASRSLPGWVCGLSIFATFLSSISFLGLPGKSFSANWNPFVFSLSLPLAAWIAVKWFVPYYRNSQEISAYAHLEHRFGTWARVYASFFYLLMQVARIGIVMFLMALPMNILLDWDIKTIIWVTGVSVTVYSLLGGIVAVIWSDALQAIVLMVGALVCIVLILIDLPGGIEKVIEVANDNNKFSFGSFDLNYESFTTSTKTFWLTLVYGLFINLNNFGIDQNYVQRYIASSSDSEANKSLWLGAWLYVPVSAVFFLIGTMLFAFYQENPEDIHEVRLIVAQQQLDDEGVARDSAGYQQQLEAMAFELPISQIGDKVFPHFIGKHLPVGVTGLLIAAIFSAAMSSISTSLNSSATLLMNDYYKRFINPAASDKQSMMALYVGTFVWAVLGIFIALWLVGQKGNTLDIWWDITSILSGGMLGIFLLSMVSRAKSPAAFAGVLIGSLVIAWMVFSPAWGELDGIVNVEKDTLQVVGIEVDFSKDLKSDDQIELNKKNYVVAAVAEDGQSLTLAVPFEQESISKGTIYKVNSWTAYRSPFNNLMIIVIGSLSILFVGIVVGKLSGKSDSD